MFFFKRYLSCGFSRFVLPPILDYATGFLQSLFHAFPHRLNKHAPYCYCTTVHVFISTKPGTEDAFKAASLDNARNSSQEAGVARFDVLQDQADPTKFVLVEVYKNAEAPALHKETAHYQRWRETVADMMAEPRQARKFSNLFPATAVGWDYPDPAKLE